MSLPMSWMSPRTVPITTVPFAPPASGAPPSGSTSCEMACMISPPMMSSGMNASPSA